MIIVILLRKLKEYLLSTETQLKNLGVVCASLQSHLFICSNRCKVFGIIKMLVMFCVLIRTANKASKYGLSSMQDRDYISGSYILALKEWK
jgi:hypothetical protein